MANTNPPKKNQAFTMRMAFEDIATPGRFKSSPTLAAGDFKRDQDGGGLNNLTTLPSVDPTGTKSVLFSLSATEMNFDMVSIVCSDQTAPPEWPDNFICIQTTA